MKKINYCILFSFCFICFFSGCNALKELTTNDKISQETYTLPDMIAPVVDEKDFVQVENCNIDLSTCTQGCIFATYTGTKKAKIQILKDNEKYNYDLIPSQTTAYPLQMGDGTYTVKCLENIEGTQYTIVLSQDFEVHLQNEFIPFLVSSQIVNYNADSTSVQFARETLAPEASNDVELVNAVYTWIVQNITYDDEKAATVENGYLPNPDATFQDGKGICFDYAALMATMLRSCGIPTKLLTGTVKSQGIYHAWVQVYIEDSGWMEIGFDAKGPQWLCMDPTFGASSKDPAEDIGDTSDRELRYTY